MFRTIFFLGIGLLAAAAAPPTNFPLNDNMNVNLAIGLLNVVQAFFYDLTHP